MQVDALSAPRWHQLSELIAARTGLHFPPERRADLQRAVSEAARDFGCSDGNACADRLLGAPLSGAELRKLARHLTIGETYFFRERPSFEALTAHVLPALIAARAAERRLRFWSAACSTGEEAYSLAMLLQQLLPDWREWDVRIHATDLNAHFLHKAENGVYGEWSFREGGMALRDQFFHAAGDRRYRVRDDLRQMITFSELNLAEEPFVAPDAGTRMDLILCRNLIIYFSPAQARRLIGNLRRSLADDGWLVVSPSECSQALFTGFSPVNFPGSIFYRRCESRCETDGGSAAAEADTATPPAPLPTPPRVRSLTEREVEAMLASAPAARASDATPHDSASLAGVPAARAKQGDAFSTAEAALARGEHAVALEELQSLLTTADGAEKQRGLGLLTRALANAGSLAEALKTSEQWIALDKLDPAAHYVNALVLQELGERARARAALHRAVYLEPGFALAHFALGNHARAEARGAEARRHFDNASRLLAGLEADQLVPESEGLTAGQLREIIVALGRDA